MDNYTNDPKQARREIHEVLRYICIGDSMRLLFSMAVYYLRVYLWLRTRNRHALMWFMRATNFINPPNEDTPQ